MPERSKRSVRNAANLPKRSVTYYRPTIHLRLHLVARVAPTQFALTQRVFALVKYSRRSLSLRSGRRRPYRFQSRRKLTLVIVISIAPEVQFENGVKQ